MHEPLVPERCKCVGQEFFSVCRSGLLPRFPLFLRILCLHLLDLLPLLLGSAAERRYRIATTVSFILAPTSNTCYPAVAQRRLYERHCSIGFVCLGLELNIDFNRSEECNPMQFLFGSAKQRTAVVAVSARYEILRILNGRGRLLKEEFNVSLCAHVFQHSNSAID